MATRPEFNSKIASNPSPVTQNTFPLYCSRLHFRNSFRISYLQQTEAQLVSSPLQIGLNSTTNRNLSKMKFVLGSQNHWKSAVIADFIYFGY